MSNPKNSLAEFMQGARALIENAAGDPALATVLAGFGYDSTRLEEGRTLLTEAETLVRKTTTDRAEKQGASQDLERAWTLANAAYMKTLKVGRVAFGEEARAISSLRLYGPRQQSLAGWLDQAGTFYDTLKKDANLAKALARFGYDQAKLEAETALIEEVRRCSLAQIQGSGAAQTATASRDTKLRELDAWVSDFRTICRVAFYENPQELEKLGVMVLNTARRRAKTGETVGA